MWERERKEKSLKPSIKDFFMFRDDYSLSLTLTLSYTFFYALIMREIECDREGVRVREIESESGKQIIFYDT
jgi:hypothetical protein